MLYIFKYIFIENNDTRDNKICAVEKISKISFTSGDTRAFFGTWKVVLPEEIKLENVFVHDAPAEGFTALWLIPYRPVVQRLRGHGGCSLYVSPGKIRGKFEEKSRKYQGNIKENSRKIQGKLKENSPEGTGNLVSCIQGLKSVQWLAELAWSCLAGGKIEDRPRQKFLASKRLILSSENDFYQEHLLCLQS